MLYAFAGAAPRHRRCSSLLYCGPRAALFRPAWPLIRRTLLRQTLRETRRRLHADVRRTLAPACLRFVTAVSDY